MIGYDGAEAAGLPGIELTTVDGRAHEVGRLAARIALAQVDEGDAGGEADGRTDAPSAAPIAPRLITRRTTAGQRRA
ncbi:hypothetical protein ACH0CV_12730 [Brachybacterium paraconglomeratum]|uniref:hypothetical protein n=1 Tax=Brachybacterium paraconglomeratum TaxID=173362 RepID=UPI00387A05BD